jgi:tRNA pseudouridine38-40 synthase
MRILLSVEYDGKKYHGWQEQHNPNTIQGKIQESIYNFSQEKVKLCVAGRTDAGVHATGQIAHFDTTVDRPLEKWIMGLNSLLPEDIKINFVKYMDESFHARFSALSRTYRYIIYNNRIKPCINRNKVGWHYKHTLDENSMQLAANKLIGIKDFSSFRSSNCQSSSPVRKINDIVVSRVNDYLYIDICANSFLYNMIRNLVGSLVVIGSGEKDINWMDDLIISKKRENGGKQFPAKGLYLINIKYDDKYNLDQEIFYPSYY